MTDLSASDLIQHSTLISDLTPEQCTALSDIAVIREFGDAEVLIKQGETDETLHIIGVGKLAVERTTPGGEHLRRQDLETILSSKPEVVYGVMRGVVRTVHRILREMNLQYVELNNYITKTHGRY